MYRHIPREVPSNLVNNSYPFKLSSTSSIFNIAFLGLTYVTAIIIGCNLATRASNSVRLFISESVFVYTQFNFVGMCMCAWCWFDGCLLFGNVGWLPFPRKGFFTIRLLRITMLSSPAALLRSSSWISVLRSSLCEAVMSATMCSCLKVACLLLRWSS